MAVGTESIISRKSMKIDEASGIYPNRVVVYGTSEGDVSLPSGAGVAGVVGVIQGVEDNETLMVDDTDVEVVEEGTVFVETSAAVTYGNPAMVADATGKVCSAVHTTPESTNIIGYFEETTGDAGLALLNLNKNGSVLTV
jgi:hypothetical protein